MTAVMEKAKEKARSIRLLILDVDGVLTNGTIYYGSNGMEMKAFHIHDGLGIKLLRKSGVEVAVISGKKSEAVTRRLSELNIEHAYLGHEDKVPAYEELKQKMGLSDSEIAFMGDDLPDLPLLRRAGLAISVSQAADVVKQNIDFITKVKAGKGAVREACEFIMEAQGTLQTMLQSYLTK
jgi:3-deoxy-D-manno-octulosonate 8-phosphate phosphatase (KDO 8-P phosphatase)